MSIEHGTAEAELRLRSEDLEWREVEGEVIALDVRSSTYFGLNRTGAALWTALSGGATRAELLARLRASFEVDEAAAVRDVDAFLANLATRGLLEPSGA